MKVRTQIGYFVTRAWVTEGIRPGVLGMSHHLGRWRLDEDTGGPRVASALVQIVAGIGGRYVMKQVHGATPFESNDPDSGRDLVERSRRPPEPHVPGAARSRSAACTAGISAFTSRRAGPDDAYGDIVVDTARAHEVYKEWMSKTRPAPGPDDLRRPLWFDRPLRPVPAAYKVQEAPEPTRPQRYRDTELVLEKSSL